MQQEIYEPEQDSHMLAKQVEKHISSIEDKNIQVLDMGSGSGIQAQTAIKAGIPRKNVLAIDINPKAIAHLKKQKLYAKKSNLFEKLITKKKLKTFDLIIFNAPYLPEHKHDKGLDTTAGKKGYEIILKFLRKAKPHLNKDGAILLLYSNLSKPRKIITYAKSKGYNQKLLDEQGVGMFEKLYVYKLFL